MPKCSSADAPIAARFIVAETVRGNPVDKINARPPIATKLAARVAPLMPRGPAVIALGKRP